MFNLIALVIGGLAFPVMLAGLIPFLGALNYLVIPMAVVGLAFGVLSSHRSGRNLNLLVLVIGVIRLWLGGFLF